MPASNGLRKSYYCLNCGEESIVPLDPRGRPMPQCPRCRHYRLYWGTWEGFMREFARTAMEELPRLTGEALEKMLRDGKN